MFECTVGLPTAEAVTIAHPDFKDLGGFDVSINDGPTLTYQVGTSETDPFNQEQDTAPSAKVWFFDDAGNRSEQPIVVTYGPVTDTINPPTPSSDLFPLNVKREF